LFLKVSDCEKKLGIDCKRKEQEESELKNDEYVWYLSYGSNLNKNRFYCYILGGQPPGSAETEKGCKDATLPVKVRGKTIPYEMVFAGTSTRWNNKGVAAIDPKKNHTALTYGRMYLITKDQFFDLVKQENYIPLNEKLDWTLPNPGEEKKLLPHNWYGKLLHLGEEDGYPIYTFTILEDFERVQINPPDRSYIKIIQKGLEETHIFSLWEVEKYLMQLRGIKGYYSRDELQRILKSE